jgi:hypothetical protein
MPSTHSLFKSGVALAAFLVAFSLIHSAQTGAKFFAFKSGDIVILFVSLVLLVWFAVKGRRAEGLMLCSIMGALYFFLVRSGYFLINGPQLVCYTIVLTGGTLVPVPLRILASVLVAVLAATICFLCGMPPRAALLTALACLMLFLFGMLSRAVCDHLAVTNLPAFQTARESAGPLLTFLGLYAGCILLFAMLYQAINNTFPESLVILADDKTLRVPSFPDLMAFSLALMVNSSYANYSGISPSHNGIRVLSLIQSLLGIVFFAIYLQLLLAKSGQPKAQ